MRSTGGIFLPGRNVLAAFLGTQGRDALRRTLQHEAFHQFAYVSISDRLPIWLNEGMAQYYEEGLCITGERLGWQGLAAAGRSGSCRRTSSRPTRCHCVDFMAMSPEDWARRLDSHGETRGATQYNQAWAMVHFLYAGADAKGRPHRERSTQMLD